MALRPWCDLTLVVRPTALLSLTDRCRLVEPPPDGVTCCFIGGTNVWRITDSAKSMSPDLIGGFSTQTVSKNTGPGSVSKYNSKKSDPIKLSFNFHLSTLALSRDAVNSCVCVEDWETTLLLTLKCALSGGASTVKEPGHFKVRDHVVTDTEVCAQWRRQRSEGARSFQGQKILQPGHPDALFPQIVEWLFLVVALKTQAANAVSPSK